MGVLALLATEPLAAEHFGLSIVAESPHFVFYAHRAADVDVGGSERFVTRLERLLGRAVSGKATYYRYGHAVDIEIVTGTYARGITNVRSGEIHSTLEAHPHEIVHWVFGGMGRPGAFFEEGLAVALAEDPRWRGKALRKIAKRERVRGFRSFLDFAQLDPEVAYPVAGAFVEHLIEEHGIKRLVEYFEATGRMGRAEAYAHVFGRDLVTAGEEWLKSL